MNIQGLTVWMVTPESGTRGKLREVLNALIYKAEIRIFRSSKEALDSCDVAATPRLIFISYSLGSENLSDFLNKIKAMALKPSPRIVVTIDSKLRDNSSAIAELFVRGITGFISEPYSTDELSQLLRTVMENKAELQGRDRLRKATGFLMVDAMGQIDQLVAQLWRGEEPCGYPLREIRNISKNLKLVFEQDADGYADLIADIFNRAKPPAANLVRNKVRRNAPAASHPGAIICALMKERLLTPQRVAAMLKVQENDFNELMREQRSVDEELAKQLARVLGRSSREWLKLQSEYDLRNNKKKKVQADTVSPN